MFHPTSGAGVEPRVNLQPRAGRLSRAADSLVLLLTRWQYFFLACATLAYLASTCYRAHRRLFWFDEIFTFYIARLPDAASIWSACTHGVDFNPPLLYLLTRWSQGLFGANELGTRMPEILGFWIFCLCLYRFVSVRTNAVAGFIALLFPLTTGAYWYAYEARPHGLVLGFFGLGLISWQAAAHRAHRQWGPLAGLAASLTCAALCHCYSFLLFIPLGFGELARTIRRRQVDVAVWATLVLPAAVSALTVLSLLRAVNGSIHVMASLVTNQSIWSIWDLSFSPKLAVAFLLVVSIAAVLPYRSAVPFGVPEYKTATCSFEWHEIVVLIAILCTPLFASLAGRFAHAPVFGRYSLIVVGAVAGLLGSAMARSNTIGLLVLSLTVLWIARGSAQFYRGSDVEEPSSYSTIGTRPAALTGEFRWLESEARGSDPIVVSDLLGFAAIFHYASPSLRSRLTSLIPDGDLAFLAEGYQRLHRCCGAPGTVSALPEFVGGHRSFYVYGKEAVFASQSELFGRLGGRMIAGACHSGNCLFHVDFPGANSARTPAQPFEKGN